MSATQLAPIAEPGDVMSPSSCNAYLNCGAKWAFRYICKLPDPPSAALTLGSAVHAAIGANFEQKIETREDLPQAGVVGIYRQAWDLLVRGEYPGRDGRPSALPTEFRDDEDAAALKAQGEALCVKYLEEAAPAIQPAAVELAVSGRIGGVAVRGYIDLLTIDGTIIDLKTAAKKPGEVSGSHRFQISTYRQLCPQASGAARVDTLTKTKSPALVQQAFEVDDADLAATAALYPRVQAGIRAGQFLPNRGSFMCSRRLCAYWRQCQEQFGGKVQA